MMFSPFGENDIFDETGKELGHIIWILCYFKGYLCNGSGDY